VCVAGNVFVNGSDNSTRANGHNLDHNNVCSKPYRIHTFERHITHRESARQTPLRKENEFNRAYARKKGRHKARLIEARHGRMGQAEGQALSSSLLRRHEKEGSRNKKKQHERKNMCWNQRRCTSTVDDDASAVFQAQALRGDTL